jgi:predicted RNA binding protein YcfA (HicA-like mRNA interferase family)
MPPKVRDLERELRRAGFVPASGKGSHRKYKHPSGAQVTLSGQGGADAKPYQEDNVRNALAHAASGKE